MIGVKNRAVREVQRVQTRFPPLYICSSIVPYSIGLWETLFDLYVASLGRIFKCLSTDGLKVQPWFQTDRWRV